MSIQYWIMQMQESSHESSAPWWLRTGCFVDLKDKQGDWRVSLVLNITKTQIRVRYDGWSCKYDQNFMITNTSIRPFRSVIRGYTGSLESPGVREHYKFTQAIHRDTYEKQLGQFIQSMYSKSEFEINQFIRGSHYAWTDFLMTTTFSNQNEMTLVYEYFFKHFELVSMYFKDMLKCSTFDVWFRGENQTEKLQEGQSIKAFAESYYQIFDLVYAIMDGYPRLKVFFKANQSLIAQLCKGYNGHLQFMADYLNQIELYELLESVIDKLEADKTSQISLSFIAAFVRLFSVLQKQIKIKQKRKQLTQKLCSIILRECMKMNEMATKQMQGELQRIYSTCKMLLLKYNFASEFLTKLEIINISAWKRMILSQKLQRKVKAINKLKTYYSNLCNAQKKDYAMILNSKEAIDKQLVKQEIIQSIFYENEHHEIIKKGCELIYQLYKVESVGIRELEIVWKSSRKRLEAVRKPMYIFFEEICRDLRVKDLQAFVQWVLQTPLTEQIDRAFFYAIFKRIVQSANEQKTPIILKLLDFAYNRLYQNRDQIKTFSQVLTMSKSFKFGFVEGVINKVIKLIPVQKTNQLMLFYLTLANDIYSECKSKQLDLDVECYSLILDAFCLTLKSKVKKQSFQEYEQKRTKVRNFLKLFQNLEDEFDIDLHEIDSIWTLFSEDQNKQFRQSEFLPWILHISYKGVLKIQTTYINHCLKSKTLKRQIFDKILRKHPKLDYINLNEMEFRIFKKFLLEVNADLGYIQQTTNNLTGIYYFRIKEKVDQIEGLKETFTIFENCRNQSVVKKAAILIKELHLNYLNLGATTSETKNKKINDLLSRIQKYITEGIKKSNIRAVKNALYLLHSLTVTVKQTSPIPPEHCFSHYSIRSSKKIIKVLKQSNDDKQIREIELLTTNTIKAMKKTISKEFGIAAFDLRLFKSFVQHKKVDDDGMSVSEASASSCSSLHSAQAHRGYSIVKTQVLEEIPNELLSAPVFSLMMPEYQSYILAIEQPNFTYRQLEKFVLTKITALLLKILADTELYTRDSSQLCYQILMQVSSSSVEAFQTVQSLIEHLKTKAKPGQTVKLIDQSTNFRLYFFRNVNKLTNEQLASFWESKFDLIQDSFAQLTADIHQNLQVEVLQEILHLVNKSISLSLLHNENLNSHVIMSCIKNLLTFLNLSAKVEQFKRLEQQNLNLNVLKVFIECLNALQLMQHKKCDKILHFIVHYQDFSLIMILLYEELTFHELGDCFTQRLQSYFKWIDKLDESTQKLLFDIIFKVIYRRVAQNKRKNNTGFHKLIKYFINAASKPSIEQLFIKFDEQDLCSFWENCLNIIKQESDSLHAPQKQNKHFSGHLSILQSLVRKSPNSTSIQTCKLILYQCLCYKAGQTKGQYVKCLSKNSTEQALSLLLAMCLTNQDYLILVIEQFRKAQQTEYWRSPGFWSASLESQAKSLTGFVGLQNPGCICYLNSFTQTLFLNEEFRSKVINFQSQNNSSKDQSLLIEMRKIFLNLQHSDQKYLNPVPFTKTIKNTEDKPMIKIFEQMDIEEYSSILFDKIEKLLPKDQDFVKEIFGGTYSNDIISKECKHCSQREEGFLSMQVDVKPTLQQSLKTMVKGETLEGENAYYCQKCNRKVRALKRTSIKKLPNSLIICLKRFEYNFETDQKFKVNASCQFPRQLCLEPYSQQSLSSEQEDLIRDEDQQTEQIQGRLPREYFEYRLKGVIIHTGSSDSGHYYALMEVQKDKWLQFNDSIVSHFDVDNIGDEAFGSDDPANPKIKSAYMLIYERKKKIGKPEIQTTGKLLQAQLYTNEAVSVMNQIEQKNKQIQKFNLVFSREYHKFINHILHSVLNSNAKLMSQFSQLTSQKDKNILLVNKTYTNSHTNQTYSENVIEMTLKYFLEYCLFVKIRQVSISTLLESLSTIEIILRLSAGAPVIQYIIKQLSQTAIITELFVQCSLREKIIVLSRFVLNLVTGIGIENMQSVYIRPNLIPLVLKFAQNSMRVMIEEGVCVNELIFIIRSLADKFPFLLEDFQKMNISSNLFEIVAGLNQSEEDKISKVERLLSEFTFAQNSMQQQNKMSQDGQQYYEIKKGQRVGKCPLKQESPQQVWNYLNISFRRQAKQLNQLILTLSGSGIQQNQDKNQLYNQLIFRRQFFEGQFLKLKQARITHFIEECRDAKVATSLALFLCQLAHNNSKITNKLMEIVKKGLKALEAIKFRAYLILLYHLVVHDDQICQARSELALNLLLSSLFENRKYFSETDILHQWIMKLMLASKVFAQIVMRSEEGAELLSQIVQKIDVHKKPSLELMKKQKSISYERLNYQIHGLMVSTEDKDYEKLYLVKKQFFNSVFHEQPLSYELQIQTHLLSVREPTYEQLTHQWLSQDEAFCLYFAHDLKRAGRGQWYQVVIQANKYGLLHIQRILPNDSKGSSPNWKKKQTEQHTMKASQSQSENKHRLYEQLQQVWETDERITAVSHQPTQTQEQKGQFWGDGTNKTNKLQTIQRMNNEQSSQDSNLSHKSSSSGI